MGGVFVNKDFKPSDFLLHVIKQSDGYRVDFNLNDIKGYDKFFTQGLIINSKDNIVLMCNNSSIHHFIVKFDGSILKTVRLSELTNLNGVPFCYNEEDNVIEFVCKDELEVKDFKRTFSSVIAMLVNFRVDILHALKYSNVELSLFGKDFSELGLVDESIVSLGYTNKLFKSRDSKVILSAYKEAHQTQTLIRPRICLSEGKWIMEVSYDKNYNIEYR